MPLLCQSTVGIKCSFLDEARELETWEYQGGAYSSHFSWGQIGVLNNISLVNPCISDTRNISYDVDNTTLTLHIANEITVYSSFGYLNIKVPKGDYVLGNYSSLIYDFYNKDVLVSNITQQTKKECIILLYNDFGTPASGVLSNVLQNNDIKTFYGLRDTDIDQILALNVSYEENDYYINATGEQTRDPNFVTSEFIQLNGKKNIAFYGMLHPSVLSVSFWNSDKEFISGTNFGTKSSVMKFFHVENVPDNAVFVRTSYHKSNPHSLIIEKLYSVFSEINNLTQSNEKLSESVSLVEEGNYKTDLFSKANNVGYIKINGIDIIRDNNWVYSDYISVIEGQQIDFKLLQHTAVSSVTLYNSGKNVVQTNIGARNTGYLSKKIIIPKEVVYIRISGGSKSYIPDAEQYVNTYENIIEEIESLKEKLDNPEDRVLLTPYAVYTTCNNVISTDKGRNKNYSQAIYLDHLFNGLTEELNIRFKDNIDRIIFNAPMVVTDSNETSPAVTFNDGENIHEEETTCYVHGKDINETSFNVKHRSTLNSITSNVHPKVLCIGDSITYAEQAWIPDDNYTQNYAYHLICKELFMKDKIDNDNIGYDITFLGIYKKQKKFTYKEEEYDVITHHEGIRGISLSQHLNGDVDQFKDDNTSKWSLQAWLNKYRTLDDDGERLTLGNGTGTLINSNNINNIDVCTPTHVIIMLGANGGGTLSQWKEMVNTIKSEFPNMIIGIAIPDAAGTYFPSLHPNCNYLCTMWKDTGSQGSRHNQQYGLQKMLQEYYGAEEQEENNIFMLPFFFVAPTAESVALRTVPLPDAEYTLTNDNKFYDHYGWHASTHVNGIGHINWGYSLYSWIKYTIAKQIN